MDATAAANMDRGSSEDESDSDDHIPLSVSLGHVSASRRPIVVVARPITTHKPGVPNAIAQKPPSNATGKRPIVSSAVHVVANKKQKKLRVAAAVPKPSVAKRMVKSGGHRLVPTQKVVSVPVSKPVANTQIVAKQVSSTDSDESSLENNNDDDISDDDSGPDTSSEEDDDSDDESASVDRERSVCTGTVPRGAVEVAAGVPIGILVSSPARLAVERLEAALAAIDSSSAPLRAQESIRASKDAFSESSVAPILDQLRSGSRLTDVHLSTLLILTSKIAANLAGVAGAEESIDIEVERFRRASHQVHGLWDHTLPQIELLAEAARKQQESSAFSARVSAQLLGSHTALADSFAKAIESLHKR